MKLGQIMIPALGVLALSALTAIAAPRSQLQRDVEGYAVATCLVLQNDAVLKEQGDGWASIIVQRGYGRIEDWQPLIDAVTLTLTVSQVPMTVIKGEGISSKQMPVFYCAEIIDQPEVRNTINATMEKMKSAYDGR